MKYGLDSMGFEREQFTEAEATKSKSAADCAVGPCDCDPHRETCEQCAPYLHEAKPQEPISNATLYAWVQSLNKGVDRCRQYADQGDAETIEDVISYLTTPQPCKRCAELEAECGFDQRNAAASQKEASMLLDKVEMLESERDALKAENTALISSGLKNEAERGNDGFLMTKIADLVQERDALAMQNQQMREALRVLLKFAETVGPSSCFWEDVWPEHENAECCDHSEVIKRHDAEVLRKVVKDWRDGGFDNAIPGWHIDNLAAAIDIELEKS